MNTNDSQTLELQIKSTSEQAKNSVDKLIKSLTNTENVLTNIYLQLGRIESRTDKTTEKTTKNVDNLNKSISKAQKSMSLFKDTFTFVGARKLSNSVMKFLNEAIDRTEQLNLFNVVFKNIEKDGVQTFSALGKEAIQFQYKLNEAFGTNMSTTLQYQALYKSMASNLGIGEQYSSIMSESLTKLTYDWASLYNKQETEVARALKSGVMAG